MRSRLGIALVVALVLALAAVLVYLLRPAAAPPPPTLDAPVPERNERTPVVLQEPEAEPVRAEAIRDAGAANAAPVPGAAARGRVVDLRTGEPVAGLIVHLDGPARHWSGTSGADGEFACTRADLGLGTWITLVDGPAKRAVAGEPRRLESAPAPDEVFVVRARIGPTFRFRIVRPPESFAPLGEAPALFAHVRNLRPEGSARIAYVGEPEVLPANGFASWEPLGTGSEVILRYPWPAETIEPGLALAEIRTQNNFFGARIVLDSWAGVQPWRDVVLQPSAILQGRIEDEQGQPIEGATARVVYRDQLPSDLPESAQSDVAGTFFVQVYDPSRVERLVVEKEGRVSVEWRIALRPGATSGQRFVLKAR